MDIYGEHLKDPDKNFFAFQTMDVRDMFHDAIVNVAAGRPWNKSAEEQQADERKAAKRVEQEEHARIQQAAAELHAKEKDDEEQRQVAEGMQPAPE